MASVIGLTGTTVVFYKNERYLVDPEVYEPAEDTFFLADNVMNCVGKRVLELGTGCGLIAVRAAKQGGQVVATDINKKALECAKKNALAHGVLSRVDFRLGDLFDPVRGKRFDLILFNPPYLPEVPHTGKSIIDRAWDAGMNGRAVIDPFVDELPDHLTKNGHALFIQSSLSTPEKTVQKLAERNFTIEIKQKKMPFEKLYLFDAYR